MGKKAPAISLIVNQVIFFSPLLHVIQMQPEKISVKRFLSAISHYAVVRYRPLNTNLLFSKSLPRFTERLL